MGIALLSELDIPGEEIAAATLAACNLPFIHEHVGGLGTNTPRRGVCVMGNRTRPELKLGSKELVVSETSWTASQNCSNCTLVSHTKPMPAAFDKLVPYLVEATEVSFPEAPISEATYTLFVANEYHPESKHTICGHTDDQPWYASPPVFVSLTFFPDGRPEHLDATFRFQIRDDSCDPPKWKDVFLDDSSICVMRADVMHRVLPPKKKYVDAGTAKRRINLTYRNLVSPSVDPLGFQLAMANHYRYYGVPKCIKIPCDVNPPEDLIARYKNLNKDFIVMQLKDTSSVRRELHRLKKEELSSTYVDPFPKKMASKSNVVLETTLAALKAC